MHALRYLCPDWRSLAAITSSPISTLPHVCTSLAKVLHESTAMRSSLRPIPPPPPPALPGLPSRPLPRNAPEQAPPRGSARRTAPPLVAVLPVIAGCPRRSGISKNSLAMHNSLPALGESSLAEWMTDSLGSDNMTDSVPDSCAEHPQLLCMDSLLCSSLMSRKSNIFSMAQSPPPTRKTQIALCASQLFAWIPLPPTSFLMRLSTRLANSVFGLNGQLRSFLHHLPGRRAVFECSGN